MLFILVLLILVLLSILDESVASFELGIRMYAIGVMVVCILKGGNWKYSFRLYSVVFGVYFVVAYIASLSFNNIDYFWVFDPTRYIESYMNRTLFYFDVDDLIKCYLGFADSNFLFNAYLNVMAIYVNNSLGGMTVYGLTLCQTIWGVLSSVVLFRILARRFDVKQSFQYAVVFAILSQFLFYSTVIIRDIVICFFYLCAFDIVDRKFSLVGLAKLVLIMIIVWGIRLYSGIFVASFIAYYIFVRCRNSRYRYIATFLFAAVVLFAAVASIGSSLVSQTTEELNHFEELTAERSAGGMVSKLQSLPPGISNFAIVLFMMIRPMPPFGVYAEVGSFSNFVMATMLLVAGFFWFVVFYSFGYKLIVKRYITKITLEKVVLLLVCLVFMLANASHPDIRRMLPVFPILFVQYAEICQSNDETLFNSGISKNLVIFYVIMAIGMLAIM